MRIAAGDTRAVGQLEEGLHPPTLGERVITTSAEPSR